jgi:hypothetical protein
VPTNAPAGLSAFITAHPYVQTILWALVILISILNVVLPKVFPAPGPRMAAFIRLLGALNIQPLQSLQSVVDLVRGTASPGTVAAQKALSVQTSLPLIAPPSRGVSELPPKGTP